MTTDQKQPAWQQAIPTCLVSDLFDARDAAEAVHLARIQLDLIQEEQDGTEEYTKKDVAAIKRYIRRFGKGGAQ